MPTSHDFDWSLGDRSMRDMQMLVPDPFAISRASICAAPRPMIDQPSLDILSVDMYPMNRNKSTIDAQHVSTPRYTLFQNAYPLNVQHTAVERPPDVPEDITNTAGRTTSSIVGHDNLSEHNRKPRGRPRVKDQFATAADRRKAQNRLAQRVLRQKKETTILKLREKVGSLRFVIQAMNEAFTEVHHSLDQNQLLAASPGLTQQLALAFEQSTSFAKLATEIVDDDRNTEPDNTAKIPQHEVHADSLGIDSSTLEQSPADPGMFKKHALLKSSIRSGGAMSIVTQNLNTAYPQNFNQMSRVSDGMTDDVQNCGAIVNTSPAAPTPTNALNTIHYTYSFEETSFARRLHRFSLEVAFHNLADPIANHEYLARTFRFCYTASDKKDLLFRIQSLLMRGLNESLENFTVAFVSIGGAGTHFGRRTADGNLIFPPVMSPPMSYGPLKQSEPDHELNGTRSGEWYDAYEVEEYLKTRGIALDGVSPFVTLDPLKITPSPDASTAVVNESSRVMGQLTPIPSPVEMYHQPESAHPPSQVSPVVADPSASMPTPVTPKKFIWPLQQTYGFTQSPQTMMHDQSYRTSTLATIDVTKLLKRISDGSACMGRSPGYRRSCVDTAVDLSLQEAYWSTTPRSPTACFV